jgi:hypothetical protein
MQPEPPNSLKGFPHLSVGYGARLFRTHSVNWGAWHFSNSGKGRFDLLKKPNGTCYLAWNLESSLREYFGETLLSRRCVMFSDAVSIRVSRLTLPRTFAAADLHDGQASKFQVTRELASSGGSYEIPHKWAQSFHEAGFEGIKYEGRFDPTTGRASLALFGSSEPGFLREFDEDPTPVPGPEALTEAGIAILTTPYIGEIQVIDPTPMNSN